MGRRESRRRFLEVIRGSLKAQPRLHERLEREHWDGVARRHLEELWPETQGKYAFYWDYIAYDWAHRAYLERVLAAGGPVLVLGPGHGFDVIFFMKRGLRVVALDISRMSLRLMGRGASLWGLRIPSVQASAHRLPFRSASFAAVAGTGVLHHLNLGLATPEIARVLRPDGVGVFMEPLLPPKPLVWLRAALPLECHESPGGGALDRWDLRRLAAFFGRISVARYGLLESLCRWEALEGLRMPLSRLDRALLSAPGLGWIARGALLVLGRPMPGAI